MPVSSVTPTTLLSRPLALCANLLAASATWQAHLNTVHGSVASATAAMAYIYYPYVIDTVDNQGNLTHARSRGIINPPVHYNLKNIGSGTWYDHGDVLMSLEVLPPSGANALPLPEDEMLWFLNLCGNIIDEMAGKSGQNYVPPQAITYLNAVEFVLIDGPAECIKSDENGQHFFGITFQVMWHG